MGYIYIYIYIWYSIPQWNFRKEHDEPLDAGIPQVSNPDGVVTLSEFICKMGPKESGDIGGHTKATLNSA